MFQKGDILEATDRAVTAGRHYVLYLEGFSHDDFIGGMITHSQINGNLEMESDHFEFFDGNGNAYQVVYDRTYLVHAKLIKPGIWGPYTKVGCLSATGIAFFENSIEPLAAETFEDYCRRTINNNNI